MQFEPVGVFHCRETRPMDAARQGALAQGNTGHVELFEGHLYEQAVRALDGFERIWLVFAFHQNPNWKPLVWPPRSPRKVGVFASRAPYRPNPIGLSCVRLTGIGQRRVHVADHDLLDGTPILDIKPYIPYADSFPDAATGWLEEVEDRSWTVTLSPGASTQLAWLAENGLDCLEAFLRQQLAERPFDGKRKRIQRLDEQAWQIAYRTWRARFTAQAAACAIRVEAIHSGYSEEERASEEDPYNDKALHQSFAERFREESSGPAE